ncbi:terminase TerL endonuclease subunit, partial [Staphylococcus pasteuri]
VYDIKYEESENIINGLWEDEGYKNERFLPLIYELDSREEWIDESCWLKANPGLGSIKKIDAIKTKVNRAKKNALLRANLLT